MQIPSRLLKSEHLLGFKEAKEIPKDRVAPTAYGGFLPPSRPKRTQTGTSSREKTALMWSKQVLEGIRDDNIDLVKIGLGHDIAEPETKVTGGLYGAPFIFGLEGFNTEEQIDYATSSLKTMARETADHNRHFVYPEEWEANDKDFEKIGRFCAAPLLKSVVRGDSALHLALRALSYKVASYLAQDIIDPWHKNEEGERPSKMIERELDSIRLDLIRIREIKRNEQQARQGKLYFPTPEEEALLKQEKDKLIRLANIPCICKGMQTAFQERLTNLEEIASKIRRFKIMALPIPEADLKEAEKSKDCSQEVELCQQLQYRAMQLIDRHPGAVPAVLTPMEALQISAFSPFASAQKTKSTTLHIKNKEEKKRRRKGRGRQHHHSASHLLTNFMDEFEVAAHKIQVAWRRRRHG